MITLTITSALTGKKGLLYEFPGRRGRRAFVPTYVACAENMRTGTRFTFAVTRDVSEHVFNEVPTDKYGKHGECPPSISPYTGIIREDGICGFRIEFFDPQFSREQIIKSPSGMVRSNLQIHFGAAASHGCILVAGRRRSYKKVFANPLKAMLEDSDTIEIEVIVEER